MICKNCRENDVVVAEFECFMNDQVGTSAALFRHLGLDHAPLDACISAMQNPKLERVSGTELARVLKRKKFDAEAISSDLDQTERENVLNGFRSRRIRILVATDVMSRGIDIKEILLSIILNKSGP